MRYVAYHGLFLLLFTQCATSNASRHFKSPLAIGRDAFKPKHASSVSISEVIDTGVNSNETSSFLFSKMFHVKHCVFSVISSTAFCK